MKENLVKQLEDKIEFWLNECATADSPDARLNAQIQFKRYAFDYRRETGKYYIARRYRK